MKNTDRDAVEFQRKYRPTDFHEMEGQTKAVATLVDLKKRRSIPQPWQLLELAAWVKQL